MTAAHAGLASAGGRATVPPAPALAEAAPGRAEALPGTEADDRPDPVAAARDLVGARFAEVRAAFVAGSVLNACRTPTSDLDIVVLLAGPPAPYRENLRHLGWPVELFVQTEADWHRFVDNETAVGGSPLLHMCAEGELLADTDGLGASLQALARERLAAGPPPASTAELDRRRYVLTDTLDDLLGSPDHAERVYLAGLLLAQASELALRAGGHWLGGGKWLSRRLATANPSLHARLTAGAAAVASGAPGGVAELANAVNEALALAGGRFWEGYRIG